MRIAIASGKGGTGKTTVATNLAVLAARAEQRVTYVDCDVEAPNGHLFLNPRLDLQEPVLVPVPQVDATRCTHCGDCARFCQYNALLCLPTEVLLFAELCHGCGGCGLVCPNEAINEVTREIGQREQGRSGAIHVVSGRLNIGEAKSPPLIHAVKQLPFETDLLIIDAPPGTSCPVVESLRDSNFVLLVTEPTPFGLHDLVLAADMVQALRLPCGVVINRSDEHDGDTLRFCAERGLPVLARLPDDRGAAEAYSRGELLVEALPVFARLFNDLLAAVVTAAANTPSMERTSP
jgi:MinD superfamily P-loop ATPase